MFNVTEGLLLIPTMAQSKTMGKGYEGQEKTGSTSEEAGHTKIQQK